MEKTMNLQKLIYMSITHMTLNDSIFDLAEGLNISALKDIITMLILTSRSNTEVKEYDCIIGIF